MQNINLKVTPEKLLQASGEFSQSREKLWRQTEEMLDVVERTNQKWQGEAATAYRNKFGKLRTDMIEIRRMVDEHVKDLTRMAETYKRTEAKNAAATAGLKDNIIR